MSSHSGHVKLITCAEKHVALLSELGAKTFEEAFSPYHPASDLEKYISETYQLDQIRYNLRKPDVQYAVAYYDYEDAGYVKLIKDVEVEGLTGRILEIEKIYVRQAFKGRKVGAALMQYVIHEAVRNGYSWLYLGVWQENTRAISFYEQFGFKKHSTRKFQLGKTICDDFLMVKDLRN
ncbi:MAG: GNAT family N-acetyltransferase [Bacteroidetes bacterium]|nr:GNAT family N-acetyltransferase [Bacteroidota bacterium]